MLNFDLKLPIIELSYESTGYPRQRLLGSLQVDISKARDLLSWMPPLSVEGGLRRCFIEKIERY